VRLLLLDKSAYVHGPLEVDDDYELCLCAVTRLELLYSARSARDYELLQDDLSQFRDLRMDTATFAVALGAQRELAASGHHRVSIPDLLIAACAHQHGADVAHVDRHFDVLARVLVFRAVRAGGSAGT
jgi:predicted nucleic acid-binding protein